MNKENQKSGNSGSRTQGGSHEQHVEAGRKGGEASHSGGRSSQSSSKSESSSKSGSRGTQGGSHEQHVEAGRKGGEASHGGGRKSSSEEDDESRQRGRDGQYEEKQGRGKNKTVKYKINDKSNDKVNQIKPQLENNEQVNDWSIESDDTDAILTVIMDEDGDVAVIETILADADCDFEPCSCNE